MKRKQLQRGIQRHVAASFPDLHIVDDLLVTRHGSLLRGFAFERSQMDPAAFRLHVFAQALSVPTDRVGFSLSRDLGDYWIDDDEEVAFTAAADAAKEKGGEFLSLVDSYEALLSNLEAVANPWSDERLVREIAAHCLVRIGRDGEAIRELEVIVRELTPPEVAYESDILDRATLLREALERSHDEAERLLDRWTNSSCEALRLGAS